MVYFLIKHQITPKKPLPKTKHTTHIQDIKNQTEKKNNENQKIQHISNKSRTKQNRKKGKQRKRTYLYTQAKNSTKKKDKL